MAFPDAMASHFVPTEDIIYSRMEKIYQKWWQYWGRRESDMETSSSVVQLPIYLPSDCFCG